ncbi:hypothetical protein LTR74_003362 [Friedmanniomyces endolithicus]|nr:hypothetical protein LTR74_003362 [Friedmanniomyces endolithicus]
MPPKGSSRHKKDASERAADLASVATMPPWYDARFVAQCLTLRDDYRGGHKVFKQLDSLALFDDLRQSLDRRRHAPIVKRGLLPSNNRLEIISSNIVTLLSFNDYMLRQGLPGVLLHAWAAHRNLPVYFILRAWSAPERELIKQRAPRDLLRITSVFLRWPLESSDVPTIGVHALVADADDDANVRCFTYTDTGAGTNLVALLLVDGEVILTSMTRDLVSLPPPPEGPLGQLITGGPFCASKGAQYQWCLPKQTPQCQAWLQEHQAPAGDVEGTLYRYLASKIWEDSPEVQGWQKVLRRLI